MLEVTSMLVGRQISHLPETRWRYLHPGASPQSRRLELYGFIEYIVRDPEHQPRPLTIETNTSPLCTLPHRYQSVQDKATRLLMLMHRESGPSETELRQATMEVRNASVIAIHVYLICRRCANHIMYI